MASILKFKGSVLVPKVVIIATAFINAANTIGIDTTLWVTSGNDGVHMPDSKHYTDEALDFRTKNLSGPQKLALARAVKARLGRDYDVILEASGTVNEHLHVEWDKKD